MNHLAKNIRLLRKNSSKTQGDIGFLVHKGQTTIGNWENGKSEPNITELLTISNFFDISVDVLLKVDLAKTNFLSSPLREKRKELPVSNESPIKYIHNDRESLVGEYDEKILANILLEVRALRQELAGLKDERLADPKSDSRDEAKSDHWVAPKAPTGGDRADSSPGTGAMPGKGTNQHVAQKTSKKKRSRRNDPDS